MQLNPQKYQYLFWPLVLLISCLGLWLRFHGQNWDEGQLLHPDERFVFMVVSAIKTVSSWSQYFDTANSTLNPHNNNFGFYVYGTLPLVLWRLCGDYFGSNFPILLLGRSISASLDFTTCLLAFASAWILFGRWAGLLAFFISATAVLPVQLSHFAAFDSYGAFFTTSVLLASILIAKSSSRFTIPLAILAGILGGCAAATKINLIIVFGLVPFAIFLVRLPQGWIKAIINSGLISLVALFFFALTFRVLQPYAFSGPGFLNLSLNPKWLDNLQSLSGQAQSSVDFPPAVQWYQRTRLHGLNNLVIWGFGLPMGLLSMAALFFAIYRTILKDYRFLLPFSWASVSLVAYCMIFPVQTIRYGIPVYPILAVLIAGMIVVIEQKEQLWLSRKWSILESRVITSLFAICLLSSLFWSFAFTRIYRNENPRIAASRWMLREIPGLINFSGRSPNGIKVLPISIGGEKESIELPLNTSFGAPFDFIADKIFLPKLIERENNPHSIVVEIFKGAERIAYSEGASESGKVEFPLNNPINIRAGELLQIKLKSKDSSSLAAGRYVMSRESSWDDGLPMRVDGFDPYGGIYAGDSNLEIYIKDGEKVTKRLAQELAKADYFYLSSNRQVGTVGRLPKEFPVAALFYQKLLGCSSREYMPKCYAEVRVGDREGQLGFELVKTFESYPGLLGISFNTQLADESFQVYDHPRVLIFRNRDKLGVPQLEKLLTELEFKGE